MGNGKATVELMRPPSGLTNAQVDKRDDPYAPQQSGGCCIVM